MSESKTQQFRPPLYHDDSKPRSPESESNGNGNGSHSREQQGWDAYRKWLTSMNGRQHPRRAPIDHSIYSWKGYHSWADRVRQSWKPEEN